MNPHPAAEFIFWISLFLIVYSFLAYPLILLAYPDREREKSPRPGAPYRPMVTLIISAYNEEKVLAEKIKNSLKTAYPSKRLQVLVLDDASNDRTRSIALSFKRKITYFRSEQRRGKNNCINEGWNKVKGEIVVFSDANAFYDKEAIQRLVSPFADRTVGCVVGELRFVHPESQSAVAESLYWKYEQFIKRLQSKSGSVLVANGAIFAVRRDLYRKLEPKIANDFQVPNDAAIQGYACVYEPGAVAYEKISSSPIEEFNRKTRIIARGFEGFFSYFHRVPAQRLFHLISQKFLRWFIWLFSLGLFLGSALLWDIRFYQICLILQIVLYLLSPLGLYRTKAFKLFAIPLHYILLNISAFVGFLKFISRSQNPYWSPPQTTRT
jgi:cellulose synthase/poly-beta-1,6-N-acetylglucosamine synthase-like glycosyltransferase